jgi:hypothetical protein
MGKSKHQKETAPLVQQVNGLSVSKDKKALDPFLSSLFEKSVSYKRNLGRKQN